MISYPLSAEELTRALDGKWTGNHGTACCPAHDDKNPSLSIGENQKGGNPLVRCHTGCSQEAIIDTLKEMDLWAFRHKRGTDTHTNRHMTKVDPKPQTRTKEKPKGKTNAERAREIWDESLPAEDTTVSIYLASRGVTISIPPSPRFLASHKHTKSGGEFPCMVAQVTNSTTGEPMGIHRTYLAPDGKGKAPGDQAKMMLGPVKGGVVRLGELTETLMIGEGIETCLSAMQVTGYPAWTALSSGNMATLSLPPGNYKVIVLADGDDAGEAAAVACASRWVIDEKRHVSIARPPRGKDFNEMLLDHLSDHKGNGVTQHPILEIINAAEEIRDPIDELLDEVKNGTLTPKKLFSQKNIDRLARRHEEDDGQAFYEGFRNNIRDACICRISELDKAIKKRTKKIGAKVRVDPDASGGSWKDDPIMGGKGITTPAGSDTFDENSWMKELHMKITNGGVTIKNTVYNLKIYLSKHPDIKGSLRLNEKTSRVEITRPIPGSEIKGNLPRSLMDEDISAIRTWLSSEDFTYSFQTVAQQIENIAKENAYNPLVDWIKSLQWDGTERLHEVMPKGWSTVDNAYTQEVGALLIKGIVARILHPGCEFRLVPILIGRQWIGKSASLKTLMGDKWVTDQLIKPASKDTLQLLRDYVIAELGEVDVLRRSEVEELKQFISSRYDDIRDPYAHKPKRHLRSCILVGTSNESVNGLLADPGENTRFLPLKILDKVDFNFIESNRDQWFAEASAWLEDRDIEKTFFKLSKEASVIADELRDEYRTEEPLEEAIQEYAAKHKDGFTPEQCAQHLVENKGANHWHSLKTQIGKVMMKIGWNKQRVRSNEHPTGRVTMYFPPQASDGHKISMKGKKPDLQYCEYCIHLSVISDNQHEGLCKKQNNKHVHRFTNQSGGCKLYEAKPGTS